jgi:flagellar M-ring protein FliF
MNGILEGLRGLGPGRLIGLVVAAAMTVAALLTLTTFSGSEPMALLYGELDLSESGQIVEHLEKQQIPYQLRGGGREVLVPADKVSRARLLLAKDALPSGGIVGYEIVDRNTGMVASQFEQRMNQLRAMEGELTRTIRGIRGVRNARVHIVLPRREPFERQTPQAQASVLLTTAAGGIDRESVQAITHLIATAVPGLKVENITIADNRGSLLSRAGEAGATRSNERAEELRRTIEMRVSRSVEEILERSTGAGKVRVEATVDLDLDRINETREQYDPEGQVARSTQSTTSNNRSTEAGSSSVSVQNNLPNADAGQNGGTGSQEQRQDETTNYEITKTVRNLVRDQAQIRRLSVAVLVDGIEDRAPGGEVVWKTRPQDELDQMARLVKTAIGFDTKRGDQFEIVSMRFAVRDDAPVQEPAKLLGLPLAKDDLMALARPAVPALVVLVMLLFILRPMITRLTAATPALGQEDGLALAGGADARMLDGTAGGARTGGGRALAAYEGAGAAADEEEISVENVEGAIKATSVRRITALVERHPEESLSIVRAWLRQEQN